MGDVITQSEDLVDLDDVEFEQHGAAMVARIPLPPLLTSTELVIPTGVTEEVRQRRNALSEFLAAWPEVEPRLRHSLFAYYSDTRDAVDDSGPVVQAEDLIWTYATLHSACVPELLPQGRFVQILGGCSWEEEHGLEICVRNGDAIVYVGPYTGKSHREPRYGKPGNFAPDR